MNNIVTDFNNVLLIANPHKQLNEMFKKSVIFLTSHSEQGAFGLIINYHVNDVPCGSILQNLKADFNHNIDFTIPVYIGGPVNTQRGFILHSNDYNKNLLFPISKDFSISSNMEILKDMINGQGPKQSLFIMGHTSWAPGQLEEELFANTWIISKPNPDLLFCADNSKKWEYSLYNAGIDFHTISS